MKKPHAAYWRAMTWLVWGAFVVDTISKIYWLLKGYRPVWVAP